jgi:hypothetical protein
VLLDAWAPMFRVTMGVSRQELLDMSVPDMIDHMDYWTEMNRGPGDG